MKKQRAERFNNGKHKWSLVDFKSLEDMVEVLEVGAKKYSPDNWKKGMPYTEIFESLMRHLVDFMNGKDLDKESGLPHTGHILCNAMFLSYMQKFAPKFDGRRIDKNKRCCGKWNELGECDC
jgi:hypothetical protein